MKPLFEPVYFFIKGKFPLSVSSRMFVGGLKYTVTNLLSKRKIPQKRPKIPIETLKKALKATGIQKTDNLFVHSGIGNIGIIEGGRKGVFNLLLNLIDTEKANILFPTFSYSPTVLKYLRKKPIFDVKKSPSYMGSLTQYALKSGFGRRSLHPTHSVLAIGKDEDELTKEHHLDIYPFAEKSPLFKHVMLKNSRILLIGVDLEQVTAIHVVEDILKERFPLKLYLDEIFEIECRNEDGNPLKVRTLAHNPLIHLARRTNKFWPILEAHGAILGHRKIGNSSITLIDARKFFEILKDYALKGITVYGNIKH